MQHVHAQNTAEPVQIGSRRDLKVVIFAPDQIHIQPVHKGQLAGAPDRAQGLQVRFAVDLREFPEPERFRGLAGEQDTAVHIPGSEYSE